MEELHSAGGQTGTEARGESERGPLATSCPACEPQKTFSRFDLERHIATFTLARRRKIRSRENGQKKNARTKQVGTVRKDRWFEIETRRARVEGEESGNSDSNVRRRVGLLGCRNRMRTKRMGHPERLKRKFKGNFNRGQRRMTQR